MIKVTLAISNCFIAADLAAAVRKRLAQPWKSMPHEVRLDSSGLMSTYASAARSLCCRPLLPTLLGQSCSVVPRTSLLANQAACHVSRPSLRCLVLNPRRP